MSADNGIYILETDGPEFRVSHMQAVDNMYWDRENGCECDDPDIMILNARSMWFRSPVFTDEKEAYEYAKKLEDKAGYTEYGICSFKVDRPFGVKGIHIEVYNPVKRFKKMSDALKFLESEDEAAWIQFEMASGETVSFEKKIIDGRMHLVCDEDGI